MVHHFNHVHIATLVKPNLVGLIQRGFDGRTTVAAVSEVAVAGDYLGLPSINIQPPDAMILDFADIESAIRAEG